MNIQHRTQNGHRADWNAGFRPGALESDLIDAPGRCPALRSERGSVLIIVLWIAIGLVSIALYFANSMNYELAAADNRVNGLSAEQAIEGAARYVGYALQNFATNGAVPARTRAARTPGGTVRYAACLPDGASEEPSARRAGSAPCFVPPVRSSMREAIAGPRARRTGARRER